MLNQYLTDTQNLLQNPTSPTSLYSTASLTRYINIARGQLAGEAECIRVIGTIATVVDQRPYEFDDIDTGVSATNGIDGVIHVRRVAYGVATGQRWITPRPWPWFELYSLNNPVPESSYPRSWAQYGQGAAPGASGSANGGSFYIDPPPDMVYTLYCDCVCYPIALAADNTPEALPYLWTDAVPYLAAYYAYLSSQTGSRQADAVRMYELYKEFVNRARRAANPAVNNWQYAQAVDPIQMRKLAPPQAGGGG